MYKRRAKAFLAMIVLVFLGIGLRLGYLQIAQGEYWIRQAEDLLQDSELLPVVRGQILDRHNNVLAMDKPCFDLCLNYQFITREPNWVVRRQAEIRQAERVNPQRAAEVYLEREARTWQLAARQAQEAGIDLNATIERIVRRVQQMRETVGQRVLEERLQHAVVAGLDEAISIDQTVGASLEPSRKRWYPRGEQACHIIGQTGQVSAEEQKRYNLTEQQADRLTRKRNNYLPGDAIGKSGVERMCEEALRGRRGYRLFKSDRGERVVLAESPAEHGRDVRLSIDINLQARLAKLLVDDQRQGSIVVLSVPDGEILAMASVPMYDLNDFYRDYPALAADEVNLPLLHRAVRRLYPPGSTAKPITALAALASGVIQPGTTFNCTGLLGSQRCWIFSRTGGSGGHGELDLAGALKNSCNVYFYHVGQLLGAQRLCQWFDKFGFADPPGTGLPEEVAGLVPTREWMLKEKGRDLFGGEVRSMAIGQGMLEGTPLHVAGAMAAIARGGVLLAPGLAAPADGGPAQRRRSLGLAPDHIRVVREGMYKVANEPHGTAYNVFHGPEVTALGVEVCAKTGTAEVSVQSVHGQIVHQGDMAWFAGFAPARNPKIAFAVVVEYVPPGGGGAHDAGPLGREALRACEELGYLP